MSKREVIAYAITHAPRGVKGGPYTGRMRHVWTLAEARRFDRDEAHEKCPRGARVIRIVPKARPSPSEASTVEVLRELVAWVDSKGGGFDAIIVRARRVLAASGPDPSEVVRAAMAEEDARVRMVRASYAELPSLEGDWLRCVEATRVAVKAYRKAGGK